ncbi:MAG: DUF2752 domain-containing protein [Lachnospiraceae bacterium]|nr:DUF2752 domain-containing protein [Lachnospiraceae bacterium]
MDTVKGEQKGREGKGENYGEDVLTSGSLWKRAWKLLWHDIKENAIGVVAVVIYIFLFQLLFHTCCPMQLILGLPCPGCGLTRAGLLLLGGHPIEAFFMHPFLYAWIALLLIWAVGRYLLQKKIKVLPVLLGLVIAGMVAFYIYRMHMYYPDTEPMKPLTAGLIRTITGYGQ